MNKKMIVYILGKMMGVEGLLLLIPALVSLIYHEKSVISFLIVAAIPARNLYGVRKEASGFKADLRKRRFCYCWACMDFMVRIRSTSVCNFGQYSTLC